MTGFYIIQAFTDRDFWIAYINSSGSEQEQKIMN